MKKRHFTFQIYRNLNLLLICAFLILNFEIILFAQDTSLKQPLTISQIEALITNQIDDERITLEIYRRGVGFTLDESILERLKKLGAGKKTVESLELIYRSKLIKKDLPKNKVKVLVASFGNKGAQNDVISETIIEQLRNATRNYSNVEIVSLNESITSQEGKLSAISKGKDIQADIVVWGWYKKSNTNVIINSHIEIISNLKNDLLGNQSKTRVEEIPNFDNFSAQLRLSKEISFLTLISLSLINKELGNFDDSIRYISDAISQESFSNQLVDLSKLYLFRAKLLLNKTCNYSGEISLSDINKAISLGANSNSPEILQIQAVANIQKNIDKSLEYTEKLYKIAKTDEDKTASLLLFTNIFLVKDNEQQATDFAKKLTNHLLVLPGSFENYLHLSFSSLISQDKVKATLYLDKARNTLEANNTELFRIYFLQGLLYRIDESYDLAIESLKKSIQLKPTCIPTYLILADAYEENEDTDAALLTYNQALEVNSEIPEVYIARGKIHEEELDIERALANYQKAVEIAPNLVESHRALGNFYKNRKKTNEAIASFTKLLAINKADEEGLKSRAELYSETGKFDLAITDYRNLFQLLAQKSGELDKMLLKAFFYQLKSVIYNQSNFDVGIEFSDKYIQFFPQDTLGYETKADFLEMKGEIDLAIQAQSQAIRLNSSNNSYYKKRALLWQKKGNLDKALEDIDQAIRLNKEDDDAFEQRAKIHLENDKFDLAVTDYKNSLKLKARKQSKLSESYARLIFLKLIEEFENRNQNNQGIEFVNEYTQLFPKDDYVFFRGASLLEKTGKLDLAIESISKAISIKSEASYYIARSLLWQKKSNFDKALEDIEQAIRLNKENDDAFEQRAKLYLRNDKFDLAIVDYKNTLKLKAKNKTKAKILEASLLLSKLQTEFSSRRKYDQGIEFVNEYIQLFPTDSSGFIIRARFWVELGNFIKAIDDVNQAIRLEPNNASYYAERSRFYEKSGDIKSAIGSLEKAIELSEDNVVKKLYQGRLDNLKLNNQ